MPKIKWKLWRVDSTWKHMPARNDHFRVGWWVGQARFVCRWFIIAQGYDQRAWKL